MAGKESDLEGKWSRRRLNRKEGGWDGGRERRRVAGRRVDRMEGGRDRGWRVRGRRVGGKDDGFSIHPYTVLSPLRTLRGRSRLYSTSNVVTNRQLVGDGSLVSRLSLHDSPTYEPDRRAGTPSVDAGTVTSNLL